MAKKSEILQERLDAYLQAEKAILHGAQSYQIGTRNLTRADLHEVRMMIDNLMTDIEEAKAVEKGSPRRKTVGVVFRDW